MGERTRERRVMRDMKIDKKTNRPRKQTDGERDELRKRDHENINQQQLYDFYYLQLFLVYFF